MGEAGWYAIQVRGGSERRMAEAVELACAELMHDDGTPVLRECFSPGCTHRIKYRGEWRDAERALLPGYVIAVTDDPAAVAARLRGMRAFARMLTLGEAYAPLQEDDRAWIEENTREGARAIPISVGYREGGRLTVVKGPLRGREATIRRVIRKKCIAVVEVHVGSTRFTTEVGLAVMPAADARREP